MKRSNAAAAIGVAACLASGMAGSQVGVDSPLQASGGMSRAARIATGDPAPASSAQSPVHAEAVNREAAGECLSRGMSVDACRARQPNPDESMNRTQVKHVQDRVAPEHTP